MDSEQRITQQAKGLFMRYGIKSITMDDVSRELGISKKTLYQFVDNKDDLIRRVMALHIEEEKEMVDDIVANAKDALEAMVSISRYVEKLLRNMSPSVIYDLQKYHKEAWEIMDSLHREYIYNIIKENLDRGIMEGLYREDTDTDIIARLYVGMTTLIVDENMFPLRQYNKEKLYQECIGYHIHGIATSKGLKQLKKYKTHTSL